VRLVEWLVAEDGFVVPELARHAPEQADVMVEDAARIKLRGQTVGTVAPKIRERRADAEVRVVPRAPVRIGFAVATVASARPGRKSAAAEDGARQVLMKVDQRQHAPPQQLIEQ